jgi:hypothetical protein
LRFIVEYSLCWVPSQGILVWDLGANPLKIDSLGRGPRHLTNFVNGVMFDNLHGFVLGPL